MSISGKPQKVTLINRIGSYYTHHSKVQAFTPIFMLQLRKNIAAQPLRALCTVELYSLL